jgi:hypothetical protein
MFLDADEQEDDGIITSQASQQQTSASGVSQKDAEVPKDTAGPDSAIAPATIEQEL